ncbi:MAG: glycosyltransferase family 2 protein [Nevskia sp.]|nr:glycosyltransferase family 2 protein [Nevskia sp.]
MDTLPFVVIPVFNGWEQTRRCLLALRASAGLLHVIVVDHGSSDATRTELPLQFPEVRIVCGDSSLWWTGATNLGIRAALAAGAELVMLLNNDCYLERDAVEHLLRHHRHRPDAIIAPRQCDERGGDAAVERMASCLLLGFSNLRLPRALAPRPDADGLIPVRLIGGGRGVLIPAAVLQRVGLFDQERLPHYAADNDFYFRCRKLGVPLLIAGDAWVTVDSARTSLAAAGAPHSLAELRRLLSEPRSHRNLDAQSALFRKHYPIPGLYRVGVFLFVLRYLLLSLGRRLSGRAAGGAGPAT